METLLAGLTRSSSSDDHYHDASQHGPVWVLINKMLHLIVLGYSLFGMIRFKVKFIHMVRLVNWISCVTIAHSWYIAVKFGFMASIMYLFNLELDSLKISLSQFNCSLLNDLQVFDSKSVQAQVAPVGSSSVVVDPTSGESVDETSVAPEALDQLSHLPSRLVEHATQLSYENLTFLDYLTTHYPVLLARLLDLLGGPYKLLGNRATLMYGFYAIAVFIMLAIFPIELLYLNIGFNYIRFVLNDTNCMRDLYVKKRKHLDRLNSWSRNQNSSLLTLSMKKTVSQRKLRCLNALDPSIAPRLTDQLMPAPKAQRTVKGEPERTLIKLDLAAGRNKQPPIETSELVGYNSPNARLETSVLSMDPYGSRSFKLVGIGGGQSGANQHGKPTKSLIRSLSTNHQDQPSYDVKVANENLKRFKPHVRSESWFKISMVVYPIFISFYFSTLTVAVGAIYVIFTRALEDLNEKCSSGRKIDLLSIWSPLDRLTFYETQYSVFALSFASSFYCSYYFGTIMELHIWIQEIAQQLELSRFVTELSHTIPRLTQVEMASLDRKRWLRSGRPDIVDRLARLHRLDSNNIDQCFNDFGGLKSVLAHAKHQLLASQSNRLRRREIMAMKLLSKRQTLLRATYVNLNLFFDELHDTRFMTQTILRRTTQIAFGFALMVSITRSQFEFNYIYLTILLLATLAILNLYLVCAASINGSVSIEPARPVA